MKLDPMERYVVAYYRSPNLTKSNSLAWLVARCMTLCAFCFGFFAGNQPLAFTGFATLFIVDIYGQARQPRWTRAVRTALEKYEARIESLEELERGIGGKASDLSSAPE